MSFEVGLRATASVLVFWGAMGCGASQPMVVAADTDRGAPAEASTAPPPSIPAELEDRAARRARSLARLEAMRAASPTDGSVRYVLARYHAAVKERDKAMALLRELADIESWTHRLYAPDFVSIASEPEFKALARRIASRAPRVRHGPTAFSLELLDLMPEGVAWDSRRSELLVGSIYRRQIFAADGAGRMRRIVRAGQDGLLGVLGIDHDFERDRVWATSVAMPAMRGYDAATHEGRAAIHAFGRSQGKLYAKWDLPKGASPNDIIVLANGTVLVTDTALGTVLRWRPSTGLTGKFEPLLPLDTFIGANGLVAAEGDRAVYVCDLLGIHRVDLRTREIALLAPPEGVSTLGGIDGLERRDNVLVGIQNLFGPGRVWALRLAPDGRAITGAKLLDAAHPAYDGPTTGALDRDRFLYLANASLQFTPQGLKPAPEDKRHLILVLKVPTRL